MPRLLIALVLVSTVLLTVAERKLIDRGRLEGVQSIKTGKLDDEVQRAARQHATYQATVQHQGHQNWDRRVQELQRLHPEIREWKEVANESWPGQNVDDAAREMYHSWRQSSGHWSAVNGRCIYYGYSMVRGANGVWYACGIFGVC